MVISPKPIKSFLSNSRPTKYITLPINTESFRKSGGSVLSWHVYTLFNYIADIYTHLAIYYQYKYVAIKTTIIYIQRRKLNMFHTGNKIVTVQKRTDDEKLQNFGF